MRLFDSSKVAKEPDREPEEDATVQNVVDRESLEVANRALKEAGFDAPPADLGTIPIKYTKEVFGRWQIDHGVRLDDYILQLIPRRPVQVDPRAIIEAIIRRLSAIVPDDVQVYIQPPNERLEITFYTIRLEGIMKRTGAETVTSKRIPAELGQIDAWST